MLGVYQRQKMRRDDFIEHSVGLDLIVINVVKSVGKYKKINILFLNGQINYKLFQ